MRFLLLLLMLVAGSAVAKPQILQWNWPTTDCDNAPLAVTDFRVSELAIDTAPMDMPSDAAGKCDPTTTDPDAPATATVYDVPIPDTSITVNLNPGVVYYARIRVSAYIDGNWSSWSEQVSFQVPYGKPGPPIWIN